MDIVDTVLYSYIYNPCVCLMLSFLQIISGVRIQMQNKRERSTKCVSNKVHMEKIYMP